MVISVNLDVKAYSYCNLQSKNEPKKSDMTPRQIKIEVILQFSVPEVWCQQQLPEDLLPILWVRLFQVFPDRRLVHPLGLPQKCSQLVAAVGRPILGGVGSTEKSVSPMKKSN